MNVFIRVLFSFWSFYLRIFLVSWSYDLLLMKGMSFELAKFDLVCVTLLVQIMCAKMTYDGIEHKHKEEGFIENALMSLLIPIFMCLVCMIAFVLMVEVFV